MLTVALPKGRIADATLEVLGLYMAMILILRIENLS